MKNTQAPNEINASEMGVMPKPCHTCPFAGEEPVQLSPERHAYFTRQLIQLKSSHLCHSVRDAKVCRGGRDLQIRTTFALGYIPEPTNKAFELALKQSAEG